jgi:hypothetical protein
MVEGYRTRWVGVYADPKNSGWTFASTSPP